MSQRAIALENQKRRQPTPDPKVWIWSSRNSRWLFWDQRSSTWTMSATAPDDPADMWHGFHGLDASMPRYWHRLPLLEGGYTWAYSHDGKSWRLTQSGLQLGWKSATDDIKPRWGPDDEELYFFEPTNKGALPTIGRPVRAVRVQGPPLGVDQIAGRTLAILSVLALVVGTASSCNDHRSNARPSSRQERDQPLSHRFGDLETELAKLGLALDMPKASIGAAGRVTVESLTAASTPSLALGLSVTP